MQEGVGAVERVERVRGGTIWTENGPVVGDLVIDQEGRIAALVPDVGRGGGAEGGGDAPGVRRRADHRRLGAVGPSRRGGRPRPLPGARV